MRRSAHAAAAIRLEGLEVPLQSKARGPEQRRSLKQLVPLGGPGVVLSSPVLFAHAQLVQASQSPDRDRCAARSGRQCSPPTASPALRPRVEAQRS